VVGAIHNVDRKPAAVAPRGARAIDRAAALLVAVIEADGPVGVLDLAAAASLPRSTTSRLVTTLERRGLLQRDGEGWLRPGPVLVGYARRGSADADLAAVTMPAMERLGEASGETVNLVVLANGGTECVCVSQVDGRYLLGSGNWVGRTVPLHCSAGGKAFLAFRGAELPEGRLERYASRTLTTRAALERDLAATRARGFAILVDELEEGLAAVGAPVLGADGRAVAVITVSGPLVRLPGDRLNELGAALVAEASALSTRLGHHPEGVG
jgi:DNA-binding IclR family transcriptional regulator